MILKDIFEIIGKGIGVKDDKEWEEEQLKRRRGNRHQGRMRGRTM